MRIRSIKPEFWRSDDVNSMQIEDRLLFIGLWSYVDDNGVGIDRYSDVVADLFAHDLSVSPHDTLMRVQDGLNRLAALGVIRRYSVAGKRFLEITNWSKHQRINRPSPGRYPRHDAAEAVSHDVVSEGSVSAHANVLPGAGEQGIRGTEDQGISNTCASADAERVNDLERWQEQGRERVRGKDEDKCDEFDAWYEKYPRKRGKGQAMKAYKVARKKVSAEVLLEAIEVQAAGLVAKGVEYCPYPATWLNGERWADQPDPVPLSRAEQAFALAERYDEEERRAVNA